MPHSVGQAGEHHGGYPVTASPADNNSARKYASVGLAPRDLGVFLQNHQPRVEAGAYHYHPSIEVNLLVDCDMVYSFAGSEVKVNRGELCVFWAAHPHCVVAVHGDGQVSNAYVSLSEFLQWPLPAELVSQLLGGAVLSSGKVSPSDYELAQRWATEVNNTEEKWQRLHALEVQTRLYRMAMDGWQVLLDSQRSAGRQSAPKLVGARALEPFERMLRYVAEHYADPIRVSDVAEAGGVSSSYAITLFRNMLGRTIKEHITDMRLFQARMLLTETDSKILTIALNSGFGSLSAFYQAFQSRSGVSPAVFRRTAQTG